MEIEYSSVLNNKKLCYFFSTTYSDAVNAVYVYNTYSNVEYRI